MLSLPLVAPRDSHELWFGSSQSYRSSHLNHLHHSQHHSHGSNTPQSSELLSTHYHHHRGGGPAHHGRAAPGARHLLSSATPSDSLAALLLEEQALRVRKQNIAAFGYAWIKPAGCPKTMLGMREEEAEREEGLAAAAAEMNAANAAAAAAAGTMGMDAFGDPATQAQMIPGAGAAGVPGDADELERDLDDDIPDADAEGLVEEGEEGFEEDEDVEDELMERNLDDDIPDAFPDEEDDNDDDDDDDDNEEDDFDDQPDLDHAIPAADDGGEDSFMVRDLDEDVPDAARHHEEEDAAEGDWQHTDSEAEDYDDDDDDGNDPFAEHFQTTTPGSVRGLPIQPSLPRPPSMTRETEAQRRFLQRWSGGGGGTDAFDTSGMVVDNDDLRASIASQESGRRNSRFGRRFPRRGGPRDSLD